MEKNNISDFHEMSNSEILNAYGLTKSTFGFDSDTTANVYNYPANRFCAEFVGSPAMNFFEDVKVSRNNTVSILGREYHLTTGQQKKTRKNTGIDVGIRGVDIAIKDEGYPAIVSYTEIIESDMIIHVTVDDGKELTVVEKLNNADEMKYLAGQQVHLIPDTDRLHLFDSDGDRI